MKVLVVLERGWSSGQIVLWVCSRIEDANHLVNLNPDFRHWEPFEVRN